MTPLREVEEDERTLILKRCCLFQTVDSKKESGLSICDNHRSSVLNFKAQYVERNNYCLYPLHEGARKRTSKSTIRLLTEPLARIISLQDLIQPYDSLICRPCLVHVNVLEKGENYKGKPRRSNEVQAMDVDQSTLQEPQMLTRSTRKRSSANEGLYPQLPDDLQVMDISEENVQESFHSQSSPGRYGIGVPGSSRQIPREPPSYEDAMMTETPPNKQPKLDFSTPQSTVSSVLASSRGNDPDWVDNDFENSRRRAQLNQFISFYGYDQSSMDFSLQKPWEQYEPRSQNKALAAITAATISAIKSITPNTDNYVKIYDCLVNSRMVPMSFQGNAYQSDDLRDFVLSFGQMPNRRARIQLTSGYAPRYSFVVLDQYNIPESGEKQPGVEYFTPFKFTRYIYDMGMNHFLSYGAAFHPIEAKKYTRKKFDPRVLKCILEYATSTDTLARVAYGAWYSKDLGLTMPKVSTFLGVLLLSKLIKPSKQLVYYLVVFITKSRSQFFNGLVLWFNF